MGGPIMLEKLRSPPYVLAKVQRLRFAILAFHLDAIETDRRSLAVMTRQFSNLEGDAFLYDYKVSLFRAVWSIVGSSYIIDELLSQKGDGLSNVAQGHPLMKVLRDARHLRNKVLHPKALLNTANAKRLYPLNGLLSWTYGFSALTEPPQAKMKVITIEPMMHHFAADLTTEIGPLTQAPGNLRLFAYDSLLNVSKLLVCLEDYKAKLHAQLESEFACVPPEDHVLMETLPEAERNGFCLTFTVTPQA